MGRFLASCSLILALAPAAMAQPGNPDPGAPPPPPPSPYPQPEPTAPPPNPYPPQPYPPQPQPYPQQYPQQYPPPAYQQPYQPYQQPPQSLKNGMTFEANIGIGFVTNEHDDSDTGLAGLNLGVGGWLSPRAAATVRLSGITWSDPGIRVSALFLGPTLQYWASDNVWVGGGAGLAAAVLSSDYYGSDSITGFGLNLRAGYTFSSVTENTFNLSLELTPSFFEEGDYTGIQLLFGYQHL